mgnify:CR=1 FL=1
MLTVLFQFFLGAVNTYVALFQVQNGNNGLAIFSGTVALFCYLVGIGLLFKELK